MSRKDVVFGLASVGSLFVLGCAAQQVSPIDLSLSQGYDLSLTFQPTSQPDLAQPGGPGPASTDLAMPSTTQMGCTIYSPSSIAAMRQAAKPGCFELDGVVTTAVTPTSATGTSITFHVQDAAGGDYSAVKLDCSSTSTTHPCTVFPTAKNILSGRLVTVQGTYIKSSAAKGGYEVFDIDTIADGGAGTPPGAAALMEADLERGATMSTGGKPMAAYWFQQVSATISDKLIMFDWSAAEFKRSGTSTACPQWFGFGLIPMSAGATAGAACNGTTQPGSPTANAKEVLVSTDYYTGFKYSSDCACAAAHSDPIPTAGQGVTGAITALLDYDVLYGQTVGYQYLAPLTNAAFTIK